MAWCCTATVDRTGEADGAEVAHQTRHADSDEPCLAAVSIERAAGTPAHSEREVLQEERAEDATVWEAEANEEEQNEEAAAPRPVQEADIKKPKESANAPFDVTLKMNPGEKLGALLDVLDMTTLRVATVKRSGHLQRYNSKVEPSKQILAGYYIVAVNGKSGKVDDMVEALRHSRTWQLRIARKLEFTINVEKSKPLAMDLQFEPESDCILVRKVGENGLMSEYNQTVSDDMKKVQAGDRIIDVNQAAGPAKTLLETLRCNRDLSLTITRPLLK